MNGGETQSFYTPRSSRSVSDGTNAGTDAPQSMASVKRILGLELP